MSQSLGGQGYDRGLEPQRFKVDYWDGAAWQHFLPEETKSDGFGHYNIGTRYGSIAAARAMSVSSHK